MDEPTRRAWSRPELIVIVRSRPEEAVLVTCKLLNVASYGAFGERYECRLQACGSQCIEDRPS